MENQKIAKILYEISEYLEMKDIPFKPRAYEKAAQSVETLEEKISDIYKKGGIKALEQIPGIGSGIAEKIEELVKTGHLKYYENLKKKMPVKVKELTAIEGVGAKMVMKLYKSLGIKNLREMERAARAGKIRKLEDFGEKTEENILKGIEFLKKSKGRFVLGFVMPKIRDIENKLRSLKEVKKIIVAGSIRRRKETVGDADLLIVTDSRKDAKKVMDFFVHMPEVIYVYGYGPTKSLVRLNNGMDFDLRVVPEKSFGAALQYFTGNRAHSIELRKIAIKKGLKLNEYGIFKGRKQIAGKTEKEVYKTLGLSWIEPELRTNRGEIEAAKNQFQGKQGGLPKIIGYDNIKGDLQIQTTWTDGANSIEEMAQKAMDLGLEYIAITDHTKNLVVAGGLDEKGLERQGKEIDKLNAKFKKQGKNFRILKGAEVNILKDGRLDINNKALSKLDMVGVAVHTYFKMSKTDMTKRIIRAIENPYSTIVFHPTGRVIKKRPAYELDMEKIIKAAKKTGTCLEVDAFPDRLDLNDEHIRMAVNMGAKLTIDSDSHSIAHLHYLEFGIAQARRGWATKKDILNTLSVDKFLKSIKNYKNKKK